MNVIDLFTGFYIISAWLLYAGVTCFSSKDGNKTENTWLLLGIVGMIFLMPLIIEYGIAWGVVSLAGCDYDLGIGDQYINEKRVKFYLPVLSLIGTCPR